MAPSSPWTRTGPAARDRLRRRGRGSGRRSSASRPVLDEGLDPREAVARPRFHPVGGRSSRRARVDERARAAWRTAAGTCAWPARHHYFGGVSAITRAAGRAIRDGAALGAFAERDRAREPAQVAALRAAGSAVTVPPPAASSRRRRTRGTGRPRSPAARPGSLTRKRLPQFPRVRNLRRTGRVRAARRARARRRARSARRAPLALEHRSSRRRSRARARAAARTGRRRSRAGTPRSAARGPRSAGSSRSRPPPGWPSAAPA